MLLCECLPPLFLILIHGRPCGRFRRFPFLGECLVTLAQFAALRCPFVALFLAGVRVAFRVGFRALVAVFALGLFLLNLWPWLLIWPDALGQLSAAQFLRHCRCLDGRLFGVGLAMDGEPLPLLPYLQTMPP